MFVKSVDALTTWSMPGKKDSDIALMSVCNEGIGIAIRCGAPLSNYSIDRRCLQQYTQYLTSEATCSLMCLVCARTFPHVAEKKLSEANWHNLCDEGNVSSAEEELFKGWLHGTQNIS